MISERKCLESYPSLVQRDLWCFWLITSSNKKDNNPPISLHQSPADISVYTDPP